MTTRYRPAALPALLALLLATGTADARRGGSGWNLSRYQSTALRDSLMANPAPGVVVLDRDFVELTPKGGRVLAAVVREWLVFVRDPAEMSAYGTFTLAEEPGLEVKKIEAYRVTRTKQEKVNVEKSMRFDCKRYDDHHLWSVEFGELEPDLVLGVRVELEANGQNPILRHQFDREIPVLQSDVTYDVSRALFDGREASSWVWWAGSWPGRVRQQTWDKPTSVRFRWGERDIPPTAAREEERAVYCTWIVNPNPGTDMIPRELRATGGVGVHGKTLSAESLSGFGGGTRRDGYHDDASTPSEASFGSAQWSDVGRFIVANDVRKSLAPDRRLTEAARKAAGGARDAAGKARAVLRDVRSRVDVIDVGLAAGLDDVNSPMDAYRDGCGTRVDQAVLMVAMLRALDLDAFPVLLKSGRVVTNIKSVDVFDAIGVVIDDGANGLFVELERGEVMGSLPARWGAALTLPLQGEPRLALGNVLASLIE